MVKAYIALGSNLGNRRAWITQALDRLAQTPEIHLQAVSLLTETKPVGPLDQPDFINGVAEIETTLEPLELLDRLLAVEQSLGRIRQKRWGPRTIDLDILFYGDQTVNHPRLVIPHPELKNRPFLQAALAELGVCTGEPHG
ncbi:MAG: 2-amino-4-hydroxy-6-hydroxymethyldihydropteridine diphosphokinase [Elusimicrobiota bacterium]|jgi:2-amino-4-hydroxy-6-hydroxymethyldihydropteridine diphosphokinase